MSNYKPIEIIKLVLLVQKKFIIRPFDENGYFWTIKSIMLVCKELYEFIVNNFPQNIKKQILPVFTAPDNLQYNECLTIDIKDTVYIRDITVKEFIFCTDHNDEVIFQNCYFEKLFIILNYPLKKLVFPDQIKSLKIFGCELVIDIKIPDKVEELRIMNNFTYKRQNMPSSLKKLSLAECQMDTFDRGFPSSVTELNISSVDLKDLPENLNILDVAHLSYKESDKFPNSLRKLKVRRPQIGIFPKLPPNLTYLEINSNFDQPLDIPETLTSIQLPANYSWPLKLPLDCKLIKN